MNPCGLSHLITGGPSGNVLVMRNLVTDDLAREERPVVSIALIMGLLYVASFTAVLVAPELPADIHEALACLPSLLTS